MLWYTADTPLTPIFMDDTGYAAPFIEGRKRKSPGIKIFLSIFLLLLVVIPLILGGLYVSSSFAPQEVIPTPLPTSVAFPTDTPTPTLTPTPTNAPTPTPQGQTLDIKTGLDRAKLTVIVENGSGRVGAANKAAQLLKEAGYIVSATRNADAYDYVDVTISLKTEKAGYAAILKEDLSDEYTVADTRTNLDPSSQADAIVIIGR